MGLFITFEGVEGSGKTTQINLLYNRLLKEGHSVILTREPGGTAIGNEIRQILLKSANANMNFICELMLYNAARAQHVDEVIKPALAANKIVLCDRFTDATIAYQHFGRGLDRKLVEELNQLAIGNFAPNKTFLFDLDTAIGVKRSKDRLVEQGLQKDEGRFEELDLTFHNKVRNGYLALAKENSKRIQIINAGDPLEKIQMEIYKSFIEILPK